MRQFLSSHVVPLKRVSYILPWLTLTPASSDARYGIRSVCMMLSDEKNDQVSGYVSKTPMAATKHNITSSALVINPCCVNRAGRASLRGISSTHSPRNAHNRPHSFLQQKRRAAAAWKSRGGGYIPGRKRVLTSISRHLWHVSLASCLSRCCPAINHASLQSVNQSKATILFAVRHAESACDSNELQTPSPKNDPTKTTSCDHSSSP